MTDDQIALMEDEKNSPLPHRDLPRRMLAAVEVRIKLYESRFLNAKARSRKNEAEEILGILRNVVRSYEKVD